MKVPALAAADFAMPAFATAVRLAVEEGGLRAAAILDPKGKLLAVAGAFDSDEARAIAALVTRRSKSSDLLGRMLDGEMMTSSLDGREVSIGIAANCMFLVVECSPDPTTTRSALLRLRSDVERMVREASVDVHESLLPPTSGSGGSSSGPAELPLVEVGVTVRRPGRN